MLSVVSHLVPLQVWKYCDDCKTVLSHPRYDVPRPGTGEDLVRQHGDLTECLWKLYFYGVERDDVYVFRVMQPPAVRHARPDVDSGEHPRRQQSSGVWYLCWPRARSRHGENGGYVGPGNCWRVQFLLSLFFSPQPFCVITHSFLTHPGYGSVIQMYPGGEPVRAGMESFGFPAHFHDMLHGFPICRVNALLAGTLDTTAKDPSAGRACFFFSLLKLSEMFIALLFPEETEKLESSTERPNKQNISRLVFLWSSFLSLVFRCIGFYSEVTKMNNLPWHMFILWPSSDMDFILQHYRCKAVQRGCRGRAKAARGGAAEQSTGAEHGDQQWCWWRPWPGERREGETQRS